MKYLSVCSGIEAATCAWHPLGWEPVAFSEIEPFPSQVLAHHYPNTPNLGDMTKFKEWPDYADVDVLVGGTPCQSFSVAGLRKGLDDPRGNLMLTYLAIAAKYRPRWLVWENVPGVLSSNGGEDFASLLRGLAELGYGWAYRVLDAQYFGVAQRRRRVFVVGYLGDWRRAAAVLFEQSCLSGHPAPSREKGKDATGSTGDGIARCITTGEAKRQDWETCNIVAHSLRGECFDASEDDTGRGTPLVPVAHTAVMPTMRAASSGAAHNQRSGDTRDEYIVPVAIRTANTNANGHGIAEDVTHTLDQAQGQAVAYGFQQRIARNGRGDMGDVVGALNAQSGETGKGDAAPCVAIGWSEELTAHVDVGATLQRGGDGGRHDGVMTTSMQVRRLTPTECERLQGFPDNYTDIKPKGKPTPDGPRYKALGNSMAVPVMHWIGRRIQLLEDILAEIEAEKAA